MTVGIKIVTMGFFWEICLTSETRELCIIKHQESNQITQLSK
jgi:hypothetical protein